MRLCLLLALLLSHLHARTLEARYTLSYWVFDDIATVTLRMHSDAKRYSIDATAALQGIAAVIAHHHVERHHSEGEIDAAGRLVPERYDTIRTYDDYRREQHYRFAHAKRRIQLTQKEQRTENIRRFNTTTLRMETTPRSHEKAFRRTLPFYAPDDLLTLYFNARKSLKKLPPAQTVKLPCVGSRSGIVTVGKTARPLEFILFIDQDIFRSKEGKMDIEMDRNFFVKKAVLKDVFLFGDLKVQRQRLEERP